MSSVASARSRDEAVTSKGSVTRLDLLSRASVTARTPLHATVAEAEAPKGDGDHRACARALQPDRASTGSYWHSSNNDLAAPISVAYTFAGWTSPSSWWGARLDRAADAASAVLLDALLLLPCALVACASSSHGGGAADANWFANFGQHVTGAARAASQPFFVLRPLLTAVLPAAEPTALGMAKPDEGPAAPPAKVKESSSSAAKANAPPPETKKKGSGTAPAVPGLAKPSPRGGPSPASSRLLAPATAKTSARGKASGVAAPGSARGKAPKVASNPLAVGSHPLRASPRAPRPSGPGRLPRGRRCPRAGARRELPPRRPRHPGP